MTTRMKAMSTTSSKLPRKVVQGYWAEVRRRLQSKHGLSLAAARHGILAYREALAKLGVGDELFHAPIKETAKIEGRAIADEEVQHMTACATVCPGRAITFGDLNNPESRVREEANSPRAFRLLEELGTDPSVVYLKRDRRT